MVLVALLAAACDGGAGEDGSFRWTIATTIDIDAAPERVWSVLTDLPAYREWNPFIVGASGTVAVGETLSLQMSLLDNREPMTIEPRLLVVDPGRELRWKGGLVLAGLFDGEHAFVLTPLPEGRTRLDHREQFAGLLLPIARFLVYDATVASFRAMDGALAQRAAAVP
jgi:hypothetical protein